MAQKHFRWIDITLVDPASDSDKSQSENNQHKLDISTFKDVTISFLRDDDIIQVKERRLDKKSKKLGYLMRLLGGQWLASRKLDLIALISAADKFRDRWGSYWVLGKRECDYAVTEKTYRALTEQFTRYRHATPLARREGVFLFSVQVHGQQAHLQVDTRTRPYQEELLTTEAQLEFAGWPAPLDEDATLVKLPSSWAPSSVPSSM